MTDLRQKHKPDSPLKNKLLDVLSGKGLAEKSFGELAAFILYVVFLLVFYINHSYQAESYIREISSLERELKDLRSEYITTKSQLMFHSKQTEVQQLVKAQGLEKSKIPPFIIRRAN